MAIAFDATGSQAAPNTTDTTLTWSHTMSATANGILIVAVQAYSLVTGTDLVTGVTYNGVAMTRLATTVTGIQPLDNANPTLSNYFIYFYFLYAPSTGANNVVVTCSAAPGFGAFWGCSASYTGVAQSGFATASAKSRTTGGADVTGTVTTTVDNSWVVMINGADDGPTCAAGTGTTKRVSNPTGTLNRGQVLNICDGNAAVTPAGSSSVVMDIGASAGESGYIVVALAPPGAAGPSNWKTYNTNAKANIKTLNTNTLANIKTYDTIS